MKEPTAACFCSAWLFNINQVEFQSYDPVVITMRLTVILFYIPTIRPFIMSIYFKWSKAEDVKSSFKIWDKMGQEQSVIGMVGNISVHKCIVGS